MNGGGVGDSLDEVGGGGAGGDDLKGTEPEGKTGVGVYTAERLRQLNGEQLLAAVIPSLD